MAFETFTPKGAQRGGSARRVPAITINRSGYLALNTGLIRALGAGLGPIELVFGVNRALRQIAIRRSHEYDPPQQRRKVSVSSNLSASTSIRGNLDEFGVRYYAIEKSLRLPLEKEGDWWVATIPEDYWPNGSAPDRRFLRKGGVIK